MRNGWVLVQSSSTVGMAVALVPGCGEVWVWAENGFEGFPGNFFGWDPDNALIGEVPGGVLLIWSLPPTTALALPRGEGYHVFRF